MRPKGQPLSWTDEVRDKSSEHRARFLESHVDLVRYLALRLSNRLPASVELDDLINDGILGLLDAVDKYDPKRQVRFRTYAESRIRGAILDGLRHKDWRPRSVRSLQRQIDAAIGELSSIHRRAATDEEIAQTLGLDVATYHAQMKEAGVGPLLALDDLPASVEPPVTEQDQLPDAPLDQEDLLRALTEEIERLPERERRVVQLYYHEGLNMKEVGAVLGVTESRVCQLHSQAASRLRESLHSRLHAAPSPVPVLAHTGRAR